MPLPTLTLWLFKALNPNPNTQSSMQNWLLRSFQTPECCCRRRPLLLRESLAGTDLRSNIQRVPWRNSDVYFSEWRLQPFPVFQIRTAGEHDTEKSLGLFLRHIVLWFNAWCSQCFACCLSPAPLPGSLP